MTTGERMLRCLAVAGGAALIGIGGFFSARSGLRGAEVLTALPVVVLGLALLALLALLAAVADPRRWVVPAAAAALTAAFLLDVRHLVDWSRAWPALCTVAGVLAIGAGGTAPRRAGHIVVVGWTRRVALRDDLPDRVRISCVAGGVHLDLRDTVPGAGAGITVLATLGYVRLMIPSHWWVRLTGYVPGSLRLVENGRRDTVGPRARASR
ncbi:hypothetical protein [Actinoplanes sp. N902-109]|uniref:hypothetical protein n=1 Tax=Actinoplanes sp. (strain N902-109) TaxID=649831 RepID=UPI0012F9AF31|nr:hypothetical protein [Actinoplanes sp. N902-109]